MNNEPLVSVLMPAYNAEKFITEAVNSMIHQSHPNWELLILDDASTDSTLALINAFKDDRIKVFRHEKNQGYLISCNELFEKAKGDIITFLDADDMSPRNRISTCLVALTRDPHLDFLTTDHTRMDASGKQLSEQRVAVDYDRYASEPSYHPTICCASIFLRKRLLQKIGGYRHVFHGIGGEDYFWLWELSNAGKGAHISENLYSYRKHSEQSSDHHADELHLFLPEFLTRLKARFSDLSFSEDEAEHMKAQLRREVVGNAGLVRIRQSQKAINDRQFYIALRNALSAMFKSRPSQIPVALKLLFYEIPVRWLRKS